MDRRKFLQSIGLTGVARLATGIDSPLNAASQHQQKPKAAPPGKSRTWLFWDMWHFDRCHNLELCQGKPTWRPEATFVENVDGLASWPTVYHDKNSGLWRMLYTARWSPYSLMVAESDDGMQFKPLSLPNIRPEGTKLAANHVFTLVGGSCGGVYLDPIAEDGYPFKIFGHQRRKPVLQRALADPEHRWHDIARLEGDKPYLVEEVTLVSRDGLRWETRPDMNWGLPDWHPEPPVFGFYNHHLGRHMMTVRPGWGDRRVCIQSSKDFRNWSGPELLLQPDPNDDELLELYGMPVFLYEGYYVGLLWMFHCETSEATLRLNRSVGPLDCQLAYSYDGVRFSRGMRRPFIGVNDPREHGCGGIEPSCLVEAEKEIRIYSSGSKIQHGKGFLARKAGMKDFEAILLHTLRKDGFMYLRGRGNWAGFITKPLVLFQGNLEMNAEAPYGEVHYQLTDIESKPIEGFSFEDCVPLKAGDSLDWKLAWGDSQLDRLVGKVIRLEVKLRGARLYAFRGDFHFIDAQDMWMLRDDKPISISL
jgi:hypothetical protein